MMSEDQKDFLDLISPLNIEARYSTQNQELFNALNNERCKKIILYGSYARGDYRKIVR